MHEYLFLLSSQYSYTKRLSRYSRVKRMLSLYLPTVELVDMKSDIPDFRILLFFPEELLLLCYLKYILVTNLLLLSNFVRSTLKQ